MSLVLKKKKKVSSIGEKIIIFYYQGHSWEATGGVYLVPSQGSKLPLEATIIILLFSNLVFYQHKTSGVARTWFWGGGGGFY